MKWHQFYNSLRIRNPGDHPECSITSFFERMAAGEDFRLIAYHHVVDNNGELVGCLFSPQDATIKIHSLKVPRRSRTPTLIAEVEFVDILPPGLKHGRFTLELDNGWEFLRLPAELFVDGDVPKDELKRWVKVAVG